MNRSTAILLVGATFMLSAAAQPQTSAQTGAQANGQAAVQSENTPAQATGTASASSSTPAQSKPANAGLSSGTAFNATLASPVDSKRCKPGDEVIAHTTENVKAEGKTVLPKGTKLIGHVTQASARAKGDADSALAIAFDRAILKSGQEVPLNIAIQAMASAQTAASAPAWDANVDTTSGGSAASGMGAGHGTGGGLTSTAGSTVGSIRNTAASVGSSAGTAVNSGVHSTTGAAGAAQGTVGGLNASGQLASNSRGVFNMDGLNLNSATTSNTQGSLITSAGKNVHLDSGTRMLMVTQATASATPNQ